ncbi:hypothetical protein [Bradyrhizobium sp. CCBAU 45389]|uniref:hypothetical protein n=1 Tax=Bradyrhizobium sp. CCBAU 45389 TaxID=858429 RepID=UPI002306D3EB|nr:hypothetical protein [Bradyrhizobium sp. CCBAU 45389]MDA9400777.1 hypothetical protein [Bradyrhizobium sp. CCBAU 45389]
MTDIRSKPFIPPSRADLAADWRRSFVNDATVAVLSRMRKTSADEIRLELRGPVSPMKVADFPGGNTVTKIMTLAPDSAFAEIMGLGDKIDLSGIAQFSIASPTSFSEAVFVEEGFPIPTAQGVFEGQLIGPVKKVALIAPLTNELENLSAPNASVVISRLLKIAVGNGGLKVLLSSDPETPAAPAGLLNGIPPIAAGASASDDLDALVAAISAAGIDTSSVAFIVASKQASALEKMPWPNFKRRVIEAHTLAPGTVIAIAADGFVVSGDGEPTVDTSRSAVLHMADPPEMISTPGTPATVAAPAISMFQTDSFALRCIARMTWSVAPGSVAWLENAQW